MNVFRACLFLLSLVITLSSASHAAVVVSLASTMNGSSYISERDATGVGAQINLGNGLPGDRDGLNLVSNVPADNIRPTGAAVGGAINFFPNEVNFGVGSLTYDDIGLTGIGIEQAPITIFNPNLFWAAGSSTTDLNDDGGFDLWFPGTNSSVAFGGLDANDRVTLTNGVLTSIDLSTTSLLNLDFGAFGGIFSFPGNFSITGNALSFQVDSETIGVTRVVANLTGTVNAVNAVPEPTSLLLMASGLGLAMLRRRRVAS
jgi:hypothetical protein